MITIGSFGYKYIFWMRICHYALKSILLKIFVYPIPRLLLGYYTYKLGILFPVKIRESGIMKYANVGPGFHISHFGGIYINPATTIGKNFTINHSVSIGSTNRGKNIGCPIFGDNVYIGPGAKIFGNIIVGNNVAIGANCVVTKNIPDNAVVVGVPGNIISYNGSKEYVINTDYDRILKKTL
jgi:serine O-acetyltransferase